MIRPRAIAAAAASLASPAAWGCATCFGEAGAPATQGMNMAILTLLGAGAAVAAAGALCVGAIALRGAAAREPEAHGHWNGDLPR